MWLPVELVQIEVLILFGEGGRGSSLDLCQGSPCFGASFQEVWDQGRVWSLAENLDKDLLVLGYVSLSGSCK